MPDMDGYEVCRRAAGQDQSRDVPVIFLTAWTDRAYMVKAFEVGGADYVTKPFLFEEVLARVQDAHRPEAGARGAGRARRAGAGARTTAPRGDSTRAGNDASQAPGVSNTTNQSAGVFSR